MNEDLLRAVALKLCALYQKVGMQEPDQELKELFGFDDHEIQAALNHKTNQAS